jgi:hypothetical protein
MVAKSSRTCHAALDLGQSRLSHVMTVVRARCVISLSQKPLNFGLGALKA